QDHQIERRPDRGKVNAIEYFDIAVEIPEEGASRAHLASAFILPEKCIPGAVVRRRYSNKSLHPFNAAEPLDVVTGNKPAHAEPYHVDAFFTFEAGFHVMDDLPGQPVKSRITIVGHQVQTVHSPALTLQIRSHSAKQRFSVVDAMNKEYRVWEIQSFLQLEASHPHCLRNPESPKHPYHHPGHVEFKPRQSMPRRRWMRVMVVMPT